MSVPGVQVRIYDANKVAEHATEFPLRSETLAVASTLLTIASDAITITQNWHRVDTEASAASDNLSTINGAPYDGYVLRIRPANDARTVVVKHNVGNILCFGNADITLDDAHDVCVLIYDANLSKWCAR